MNEDYKNKKRTNDTSALLEKISYIVIICVLVLSLLFQIYKLINCKCIIFCDEYAKTFLNIQVGIIVVPISLLALLSGLLREGFLGVGYIEYSLRIKPKYFKQKTSIMLLLLFLFFSVILYIFHLDVLVFGFMIGTFIIIGISLQQLFDAIINGDKTDDEIEKYYLLTIELDNIKEMSFLLDRLYDNAIVSGKKEKKYYESIKRITEKICESISTSENSLFLKEWYNDFSKKMMETNCECGLFLVFNYYVKYIKECCIDEDFYKSLNKCLENINLEKIQSERWFGYLIQSIPRIIGYTYINDNVKKEELKQILELLGRSLGENIAVSDSVIIYDKWNWLTDDLFSYSKINQNGFTAFLSGLVIGLIRSGAFVFTKKVFFDKEFQKMHTKDDINTLEFYVLIHCYLRYLAYYEELVDNQIINGCVNFLKSEPVIKLYRHILEIINSQVEDNKYELFDGDTKQDITNVLRRLGEKTKHGAIVDVCQDEVTDDYWVFIIELLTFKEKKELLEKFIKNEEVVYYYITYVDEWEKKEKKFDDFYNNFYDEKIKMKEDQNESEEKLQKVKNTLEKMYIKYQLDKREVDFDTEELKSRLKEQIEKKIKKEFKILKGEQNSSFDYSLNLFCINNSWFAIKEVENILVEKSVEEFAARLIEILKRENRIETINNNDEQLQKLLKSINDKILVGSTLPLYRLREPNIGYAGISKIRTLGGDIGKDLVILEPDSIVFNNIEINVKCGDINIKGFRKNNDGTFDFSFSEGMIVSMTEEEMRHLVEDESTRMEINVKLKMSYGEEKVGKILEYNDSPNV